MIKLVAVNVKRLQLMKDEYVEVMTRDFLTISGQPQDLAEKYFSSLFDRVTGRKWELRHHHFREIHLLPDTGKIGLVWYRTHKEPLFSDVAALLWISTDEGYGLKKYSDEIFALLRKELEVMEIKRLTAEVLYSDEEYNEILRSQGFETARTVVQMRLE